jgi:flavin reductase (DIM6/NTAB) family NADH-FMN oxidoreductase RutF
MVTKPQVSIYLGNKISLSGNIPEALKEVMRVYPQGVTVVTASTQKRMIGLTVSSFISVSLEPSLLLVSISKKSANHDTFLKAKEFAVNFLADDQKSVSDTFAGRLEIKERFEGLRYHFHKTKSPIIDGVRAFAECKTWEVHDGGDHSIILGEVVHAKKMNDKPPLVYYTQQYTTIVFPENAPSATDILW